MVLANAQTLLIVTTGAPVYKTHRLGIRATVWSSAEMQGGRKREIPEKTRRPAASPGMIPTCENPGATLPGIEPGVFRSRSRLQQGVVITGSALDNSGADGINLACRLTHSACKVSAPQMCLN
ncbi:hypothetical protein PR048_014030 [Dryococelus australis]|uniref:Uncharacterized protein n=1 Tax=Dryococelus australis TaxID=614101 RepID=A0ABQ9HUB4_9NEOP|nr:hypothetical protein PR048_014030 [Dryococelus australis]